MEKPFFWMCSECWFRSGEPCREVSQSSTQWNKSFQFSLSAILKLRKLALMLAVPAWLAWFQQQRWTRIIHVDLRGSLNGLNYGSTSIIPQKTWPKAEFTMLVSQENCSQTSTNAKIQWSKGSNGFKMSQVSENIDRFVWAFLSAHFYFIISARFYEVTVVPYFTVMIICHDPQVSFFMQITLI